MPESLDSYLKREYGLSESDYWAIAQSQNYVCAACRCPNRNGRDGEPERLAVDHSHYSGANRGLLCQRCNKVLGLVADSQEILLLLLEYLRRYDGSQIPGVEGSEIRLALQQIRTAELPSASSK